MNRTSLPRRRLGAVCLLLAFGLAGCKVVEETTKLPMQGVRAVMPGGKSGPLDPVAFQVALQRYADEFSYQTGASLDEYARRAGTPEARNQAQAWKLAAASSAYSIASGPSPIANLLDFVCLASLTHAVLEEHWVKQPQGELFQHWLDSSRVLESNAWQLARMIFYPAQLQDLRAAIQQWRDENPSARTAFFARPHEITQLIRKHAEKSNKAQDAGGLLSMIGLDPTAGLDPAVREVTRTRMFAERAMFTAQRTPSLLRWQVEVLTSQLLREPPIAGILTNVTSVTESVDRLSRATESASQTVAALPERISAERKAVLAALDAQEGRLRDLTAEVGRTLGAADKMSTSLNTTLTTFDALMKRFGVGEPVTNAAPASNSPPFNILDYARTAERLAEMARELDAVIKDAGSTLDSPALAKRVQELGAVAGRARDDAKSVLNHAFLLAGALVVFAFLCALVYRRVGRPRPSSEIVKPNGAS